VAAFGNDIVKLEVADLAGGRTRAAFHVQLDHLNLRRAAALACSKATSLLTRSDRRRRLGSSSQQKYSLGLPSEKLTSKLPQFGTVSCLISLIVISE
jgi:hypothetical protein